MFKVWYVEGNQYHCICCRACSSIRNEYPTLPTALARAAELMAQGSWGQDITQVRVLDESGEPVGLDNDGFAALLKAAEEVVRREHVRDLR